MPPIGYIAYIDEAGDDGTRKIKTDRSPGASEWMILSAVLVKVEREKDVLGWVQELVRMIGQHQITHLHFRTLPDDKKEMCCNYLSKQHVRLFSMISNKRNIEGRRNIRAERAGVNRTARFYCWMTRLLLEEITDFCARRTLSDYGEKRIVRFEFSDRGGLNIKDIRSYYKYIQAQTRMETIYIDRYNLDWSVVDTEEFYVYPNKMRAGLQLSDIVASAFYAGLERTSAQPLNSEFAKLLFPRMARGHRKRIIGTGVKFMPRWLSGDDVAPDQSELVRFYVAR
jgi:hypothetical protein